MNRGIIIVLILVAALGAFGLYAIQRGPALFMKPPTEDRIAFISDRAGHADIYNTRSDGSDLRRVTSGSADNSSPSWSPDAMEIAYTSNKEDNTYQVYIAAWDGRYSHRITTSAGTKTLPTWTNGGKGLTFLSSAKVYNMNLRSGDEEQYLPPTGAPAMESMGGYSQPYVYASWSPKQNYLLYIQETDLGREAFTIEPRHGMSTEDQSVSAVGITIARNLDVAWSPIGSRVAAAFIDRKGTNGLLVADLDAVSSKDLFVSKGDGRGPANPAWSPDGSTIAFEMWTVKDGSPDKCIGIYTIDSNGGSPKRVVAGDVRTPTWSPDGSQLAFSMYGKNGKRDIWRVNVDGSGAVNITKGNGDNYSPTWSPSPRKNS